MLWRVVPMLPAMAIEPSVQARSGPTTADCEDQTRMMQPGQNRPTLIMRSQKGLVQRRDPMSIVSKIQLTHALPSGTQGAPRTLEYALCGQVIIRIEEDAGARATCQACQAVLRELEQMDI